MAWTLIWLARAFKPRLLSQWPVDRDWAVDTDECVGVVSYKQRKGSLSKFNRKGICQNNSKQLSGSVNPKGNQARIFTGRALRWGWSSNTLAIWWEEPTHWEKTKMLGKIEGRRRRRQQRMRWQDGIINSVEMSFSKLWESGGQSSLVCAVHGVSKSWTRLATKQQLRIGAQTGNAGLKLLETKGWGILRHRISVKLSSQENWPHKDFWSRP